MTARNVFVFGLLLLLTGAASAVQFPTIATQPPNPIAGSNVTVLVGFLCPELKFNRVVGHVVELGTVNPMCISASIPGQQPFDVGPLEAGTYEVHWVGQETTTLGTFEVAALPADVPALDARTLWILAAAILALGIYGIGRTTS